MNRRRKHGDFSGLKNTPRKAAAAEEYSSVAEPGKRRLRSARSSALAGPGAGEGPVPPGPCGEQPPPVASCSKSYPEEKYETPERMLKIDVLSSAFSSPNDPDGQNDIFWDQNSPMTKQLGKGRKKKICITDSDEIAHIVNRIAPQDEKPTTNSMLGVWIGATAIPCTPNVAKGKSRTKLSCTKLKTQNQEEELMKLAKQFDKNMEELGVIQDHENINHDFIQMTSETEPLNNYNNNVQIQLSYDMVPEIDNAVIQSKPSKENTRIPVADDQNISQKPFDQNAEAALNAIFDGSTQKCSGQLSQDLSHAFLNTNNTTIVMKNSLKEEKSTTRKSLATQKLPHKTPESLSHQQSTPVVTKSCVTSDTEEAKALNKHTDINCASDFEDDWENLLGNETFVIQSTKIPELSPVPKTFQIADQNRAYTFNRKSEKSSSRTKTSLEARLIGSKILPDLPSAAHTSELIDAGKCRFLSNPNNKANKLLSTVNELKFDKSLNKMIPEDKFQDSTIASSLTNVNEDNHTEFTSNADPSEKKSTLCIGYSNEQKSKCVLNRSLKTPANKDSFDFSTLDNKTSVCHPNQTHASKLDSFFDDWNDPSFDNEMFKTCHQLENKWEVDDVDDDLLYQACDDVEKLTQQQDIEDSKTSKNMLENNNSYIHGTKNVHTTSEQGSQLLQSNHLNLGSIFEQTSLTKISQRGKLEIEKKEICENSSSISAVTNMTMNSSNRNCQTSNLTVSWNNTDDLIQMDNSKSVLKGSSSMSGSLDNFSTEIAIYKNNLNTQHLPYGTATSGAQNNNTTVKISKYTFTKIKNAQTLSQVNQSPIIESTSDTKITLGLEKNKTVNTCAEAIQQKSLLKHSESLKQPSIEEEDKNRKYSPEEIQRKRQEALVRRMAKAQASSIKTTPN